MSTWAEVRPSWIKRVNAKALLSVISQVAAGYGADENLGDTAERAQSILWLSTRGEQGKEWGHGGDPVMRFLDEHGHGR